MRFSNSSVDNCFSNAYSHKASAIFFPSSGVIFPFIKFSDFSFHLRPVVLLFSFSFDFDVEVFDLWVCLFDDFFGCVLVFEDETTNLLFFSFFETFSFDFAFFSVFLPPWVLFLGGFF